MIKIGTESGASLPTLFDHFVGAAEERLRYGEPQLLCRLQVDHQLEDRRLHYRKISGLLAAEDLAGVNPDLPNRDGPLSNLTAAV